MALVNTFIVVVLAPLFLSVLFGILGVIIGGKKEEEEGGTLSNNKETSAQDVFFGAGVFFLTTFMAIFIIVGLIITPSVFISQHMASINLPQKYITTTQAIEEAKQMIIAHENNKVNPNINLSNMNFGQLGKGLEAIELKQRLVNLVEERAELKRKIRYRNRSPWVFFKPKPLSEIKIGT